MPRHLRARLLELPKITSASLRCLKLSLRNIPSSGSGWAVLIPQKLAGLEPPTAGTIVYNGATITGPGADLSLIFLATLALSLAVGSR